MFAQRSTQQALRRLAISRPTMVSQMASKNLAASMAVGSLRSVSTEKMTPTDSMAILIEQRKKRPTSPHLTIYKPQVTWILSGLNRLTGVTLSGTFYLFGAAYLVAPLFGWHLESASMAAAFGAWPITAKVATKFAISMPFTFHSFNGLRYLTWDTTSQFANKQVIRTGWAVVGLSTVSALGLATMV